MVRVAELLEAEGRSLRRNSVHVGMALASMLTGSLVAVIAVAFFVAAIYLGLREFGLGEAWSAVLCGFICAGTSAIFVLVGRGMVK